MVGNAWYLVIGGLLLGADVGVAESQRSGHFPDSQDQRNTVRSRAWYQITTRLWVAAGIQYDTGLPFEFDGEPATVLAEYGQQVLDQKEYDTLSYEAKIARIAATARARASATGDLDTWTEAVQVLRREDHYLLVLLAAPTGLSNPLLRDRLNL